MKILFLIVYIVMISLSLFFECKGEIDYSILFLGWAILLRVNQNKLNELQ